MRTHDPARQSWRFLDSTLPWWLVVMAMLGLVFWLGTMSWLAIELIQGITGLPGKACP